jgi:hypothetical protein
MKTRSTNFLWGFVLILAGALFLAQNLGYIPLLSEQFWMAVFAGLSIVFFAGYFLSGIQNWGLLFPACIFGALALTTFMTLKGMTSSILGTPIFLAVGLPFVIAFALDRQKNWWALIPAWVMVAIAVIIAFVDLVPGEVIGTLILLAIAIPFLVVYMVDRTRKWALIPGGVLAAVSVFPLIALFGNEEVIGSLVLFVIALPFFVVYFWTKENWWALIPAGVLASIGLALLVASLGAFAAWSTSVMNAIIFLGWGITFLALWLRRDRIPTAWAIYPAVGLGAAALLSLAVGSFLTNSWPILLIVGGGLLLWFSLRPKKLA